MKNLKILISIGLFYVCISCAALIDLGCGKTPQEPPEHIHHDHEVVVVDSFHVHHDHQIVVIDTIFQNVICDTVDLKIEFTVIGDQSAPNIYIVFLNGVSVYRFVINETFPELTEVKFQVEFIAVTFWDTITVKKFSGSRAEAIGSSIIDIKCSGG